MSGPPDLRYAFAAFFLPFCAFKADFILSLRERFTLLARLLAVVGDKLNFSNADIIDFVFGVFGCLGVMRGAFLGVLGGVDALRLGGGDAIYNIQM